MKSKVSKYKSLTLLILFRLLLDLTYSYILSPLYSYSDYNLNINYDKYLLSYVFLFGINIMLPKDNSKISSMIIQLHFIVMIIPMLSIYGLADLSNSFMFMVVFCFLLQLILLKSLPLMRIRVFKNAKLLILGLLIMLTVISYSYLVAFQEFNISSFNFSTLYELRDKRNINALMSYLLTWQFRIINPAIIVFSYFSKNNKLMLLGIFLQTLIFLYYPNKEIILSLLLITFVLLILQKDYILQTSFVFATSLGIIFTTVIYYLSYNIIGISIMPFRFLFIPAFAKFGHYKFFSENPKLYYSEGLIGTVFGIKYPYNVVSGRLINDGKWANANTGYLAYAYDNSGILGMIIMSILFIILLKYIDSLVQDTFKKIALALLVYPMVLLNDGDLLTMFLTGGLFLLLLILAGLSKPSSPVGQNRPGSRPWIH